MAVADAHQYGHRYTSGVIDWHPDESPTDGQVENTLDEFERTILAGLERSRYKWSAILHLRDCDGKVHVIGARVDRHRGRSLNIPSPGSTKAFGTIRNALNHEHGWAGPDDSERAPALARSIPAFPEQRPAEGPPLDRARPTPGGRRAGDTVG